MCCISDGFQCRFSRKHDAVFQVHKRELVLLDLDIAMKGPSSVCLSLALARALRLRSMSVLLTLKLYKHDLVNHQQLARFDLNENKHETRVNLRR